MQRRRTARGGAEGESMCPLASNYRVSYSHDCARALFLNSREDSLGNETRSKHEETKQVTLFQWGFHIGCPASLPKKQAQTI
eukprot:12895284-Ditylum_brightwellii.AAC.1